PGGAALARADRRRADPEVRQPRTDRGEPRRLRLRTHRRSDGPHRLAGFGRPRRARPGGRRALRPRTQADLRPRDGELGSARRVRIGPRTAISITEVAASAPRPVIPAEEASPAITMLNSPRGTIIVPARNCPGRPIPALRAAHAPTAVLVRMVTAANAS